jgi:hypothetical protein
MVLAVLADNITHSRNCFDLLCVETGQEIPPNRFRVYWTRSF